MWLVLLKRFNWSTFKALYSELDQIKLTSTLLIHKRELIDVIQNIYRCVMRHIWELTSELSAAEQVQPYLQCQKWRRRKSCGKIELHWLRQGRGGEGKHGWDVGRERTDQTMSSVYCSQDQRWCGSAHAHNSVLCNHSPFFPTSSAP